MRQKLILITALLAALFTVLPALAEDTDIYGVSSADLKPNIMIILDTSGSMEYKDVETSPYNSATDYPGDATNNAVYYYGTIGVDEEYQVEECVKYEQECNGCGDCWDECVETDWVTKTRTVYITDWILLKNSSDQNVTLADLNCSTVKSELESNGNTTDYFNTEDLSCNGSERRLRMGSFFNYEDGGYANQVEFRFEVAKDAIIDLLNSKDNAKFGLTTFDMSRNSNGYRAANGGDVQYACGTDPDTIAAYVDGLDRYDFDGGTPLAETLAETGLYFSGQKSWFNHNAYSDPKIYSGGKYVSPIDELCQKNYVILVTDGAPSADIDPKLWTSPYINVDDSTNRYIGKYKLNTGIPEDTNEFSPSTSGGYYADPVTGYVSTTEKDTNKNGTINKHDKLKVNASGHFLDDVAKYLNTYDIFEGTSRDYAMQTIATYVISFTIDDPAANTFLRDTADGGGGDFYYANSALGLSDALDQIMNSITEKNAVFAAPAVPINRVERTGNGEWIYFSYFKPQNTGEWLGNLKKYKLGTGDGTLLNHPYDVRGRLVYTYNSLGNITGIEDDAMSFWTTEEDGNDVEKGGAGTMLLNQLSRNVFYLKDDNKNLWEDENIFKTGNDVPLSNEIITKTLSPFENWKMGAVIHCAPAVVHYSLGQSVIFVGANDGMLHCINDFDGKELWAFIPPGQRDNLSAKLSNNIQDYFVDGQITVSYGDIIPDTNNQLKQPETLIFGERRGGSSYYALDISQLEVTTNETGTDKSTHVKYKYQVKENILTLKDNEVNPLGQSWSKPVIATISTGVVEDANGNSVINGTEDLFLLAGGYDTNQDLPDPAIEDGKGKAIFGVTIADGKLSSKLNFNHKNCPELNMKNCFVSFTTGSYSTRASNTEITTRIYAGDLGGYLFGFADDIKVEASKVTNIVPTGDFITRKLLFKPTEGSSKKIFYAPAVTKNKNLDYEWVVFATGDITHPFSIPASGHQNRLYVIKNDWKTTVTEANLLDITDTADFGGDDANDELRRTKIIAALETKDGWYMDFEQTAPNESSTSAAGEKLTSNITINDGALRFTTYFPTDSSNGEDICQESGAQGEGRLYAISLETGIAFYDYDKDGKHEDHERWSPDAIPPMTDVIDNGGALIGHGIVETFDFKSNYDYYFWRQN